MELEVEERVRVIDLAWEWVDKRTPLIRGDNVEGIIEGYAKRFDQAYKAIVKTVTTK